MNYLEKTYERMASTLDPSAEYFDIDSRFMTLEILLRSFPRGKMFDMGCGRGALMKRLRDHHEVFGCDYEQGAVDACVAAGLVAQQIDLNDADEIPFRETFDVIVMSEVCEHLLDPRNAIQLAKKSLRSGGTLLLTVPNSVPLFVRLSVPFGRTVPWLHYPSQDTVDTGHIRFYTLKSMSSLLKDEGFDVTDVRGLSFRMNGRFWARVCFWTSKLVPRGDKRTPTKIDSWLGRQMPGLSPGLLFVCQAP